MKHFLSKSLSINSDVFFKVDKASNRLLLISHFGKFHFYLFNASCFLVKEGQKLTFLYKLEASNKKSLRVYRGKLGSLAVFFDQLVSRLSQPNSSSLSLIGMGYRSFVEKDNCLSLNLGFSHKIDLVRPENVRFFVRKVQRQHEIFFYCSTLFESKNLASKVIRLRPVSPYTGKGLLWSGTAVIRKEGKGQFKR